MSFNSPNDTIAGNLNMTTSSVIENGEPERLQIYRSTVENIMMGISNKVGVQDFSQEFKRHSMAKGKPEVINALHDTFTQSLYSKVNTIIEKQIKEDNLEEKFSQLSELISSSSSPTPAWRPSRNIQENMRSQLMQEKIKLRDELKYLVSKKEGIANKLKFDITTSRNQTKHIEERLQHLLSKFDVMMNEIDRVTKELEE